MVYDIMAEELNKELQEEEVKEQEVEAPKEEKKKDVSQMTPEEIDKIKYKERQKKEQTISKVLKGVNDTWEKEYNFEELDLHFVVKVKLPNAIEQGRIFGLRSSYLNGMDMYQTDQVIRAYQMLATLQEVGIEVPKEFQDPEDIYNIYPLAVMYEDWLVFLNSFRY